MGGVCRSSVRLFMGPPRAAYRMFSTTFLRTVEEDDVGRSVRLNHDDRVVDNERLVLKYGDCIDDGSMLVCHHMAYLELLSQQIRHSLSDDVSDSDRIVSRVLVEHLQSTQCLAHLDDFWKMWNVSVHQHAPSDHLDVVLDDLHLTPHYIKPGMSFRGLYDAIFDQHSSCMYLHNYAATPFWYADPDHSGVMDQKGNIYHALLSHEDWFQFDRATCMEHLYRTPACSAFFPTTLPVALTLDRDFVLRLVAVFYAE